MPALIDDAPRTNDLLRFRDARAGQDPDERDDGILPSPHHELEEPTATSNASPDATDDAQKKPKGKIGPVIRLPDQPPRLRRLELLQQWEGVVTEVTSDSVWAQLVDLTDNSNAREIAEILIEEIPPADRPLLRPGSVLYWSIGYETKPGGQICRVSEIRVRRTASWSQREVSDIKSRAAQLLRDFTNDQGDPTTPR